MYYCRHRKREHLSSLLNEVQQLITYKFFSVFEHLVFHLHLVHMTAARSRRAPGRAGFPQAFSDKEDALSQLTEGKGRGKRKRFLRPLPPPPDRGPAQPNGVFTLQKNQELPRSIKRWRSHCVNASPFIGAGTFLPWQPFYRAPNATQIGRAHV